VLCCRSDPEGDEEICFSLFQVSGLRRLRVDGEAAPGLEVRLAGRMPRLQLLAVPSGHGKQGGRQACTSWARLQLLHAFIALTFESKNEALAAQVQEGSARAMQQDFSQVCPLEWPLEGGQRASLEHLALVLRGVTTVRAREVPQLARFGEPACPLCLERWEEMPPERSAVVMACGHNFCELCLGTAVAHQQTSCPSCRQTLGPSEEADHNMAGKRHSVPMEVATLT